MILLLAIPLAALYQAILSSDGGPALHAILALGSVVLAMSIRDFKTPRWTTLLGYAATVALAAIFLLQGVAELVSNASLSHVAFEVLGQRVESVLSTAFLVWCVVVIVVDSQGKTKLLGAIALSLAAAVQVYAVALALLAAPSIDMTMPGLKLLYLAPFVWLLVASRKKPDSPVGLPTTTRLAG